MSVEMSRKYAWFGKTDHGRSLSIADFISVCDDIINAESEEALKQSTKAALKVGRAEVHRSVPNIWKHNLTDGQTP